MATSLLHVTSQGSHDPLVWTQPTDTPLQTSGPVEFYTISYRFFYKKASTAHTLMVRTWMVLSVIIPS
eukprot:11491034-Ditylum_brightwellii.AAC.1